MSTHQGSTRRKRSEEGASVVEYALLLALIVMVCIISITFFGTSVGDRFSKTASSVDQVSLAP